jgi:uncharacterized alkaline shock family protein YloU
MTTADPTGKAGKAASRPAATSKGEVSTRDGAEISDGDLGKVSIADTVVAKIVGIAARDVPGVHGMGSGTMTRTFGAMRDRIPGAGGPSITQGVTVEVGEEQAAVDLDVVVEYGVSIPDLAAGIRRNVVAAVERMCGLEAKEVNISVGDVHLPGDDEDAEQAEPRVQ